MTMISKGNYYYYLGRMKEALCELDKAAPVFREHLGTLSFLEQLRSLIYNDSDEYGLSRESLKRMIDLRIEYLIQEGFPEWQIENFNAIYHYCLGRIDLREGLIDSAKSRLAEIEAIKNNIEISEQWQVCYKHTLLSVEILLTEKSFDNAIATCEKISWSVRKASSVWPGEILYLHLYPYDLLARIYKEKADIDKAIVEYERLTTFDPNDKDRRFIHPRFHYELAKLYEEKGITEKENKV